MHLPARRAQTIKEDEMAYTKAELGSEFWMLTKGILQDGTVDTDEASVIKRWLE